MKKFSLLLILLFFILLCLNTGAVDMGLVLDFSDENCVYYSALYEMYNCDAYYDSNESAMRFKALGADPHFSIMLDGNTNLSDYPVFAIKIKNTSQVNNFEMYMATDGGEIVDEGNNFKAKISGGDTEYITYIWNGAQKKPGLWKGLLTLWRFDCLNDASADDICYIKGMGFFKSEADAELYFDPSAEHTTAASETTVPEPTATETNSNSAPETNGNTTSEQEQPAVKSPLYLILACVFAVLLIIAIILAVILRAKLKPLTTGAVCIVMLILTVVFSVMYFTQKSPKQEPEQTTDTEQITDTKKRVDAEDISMKYTGPFVSENGDLAGIDALGRVIPEDNAPSGQGDKQVGIFYFLWLGVDNSRELHDNTEIIKTDPTAYQTEEKWLAAGGGGYFATHFWGKPLFGYYTMNDEWVIGKHAQMLSAAGVDYIIFDTTNSRDYIAQALKVLKIFDGFYKQGVKVPTVAFYTNTGSGERINNIYNEIYAKYNDKYSHLWFQWNGKPLIIGKSQDKELNKEAKKFFTIKESVWPNEEITNLQKNNGWPWMEFGRLYTDKAIYGKNGRKEVISVSAAQHCDTVLFSETAFYNGNDHTRSWHNGANDKSKDAVLYGYNFADQWEWAIEQNPETIFVTAFNEWAAQRMHIESNKNVIQFFDCADIDNSRDIEPMSGGFGDNYLMQFAYYTRLYKGSVGRVDVGENRTVDISGSFNQFDTATAVYRDPANDIYSRNAYGFSGILYKDSSGRNNIEMIKAVKDDSFVYFYIKTSNELTDPTDEGWMTLFISSGGDVCWNGYDFIVNRTAPQDGNTSVERCTASGEWKWEKAADAQIRYEGSEMIIKIPRSVFGSEGLVDLRFKIADNYTPGDIMSFYTSGDCAPYGRFNYVFSNKKK